MPSLKISPGLKCVATLPCEMSLNGANCHSVSLVTLSPAWMRRPAAPEKFGRLYVQICSFWHKTSIQSLIFHPFCPNALTKNFIWGSSGGQTSDWGAWPPVPPLPLEPPLGVTMSTKGSKECTVYVSYQLRMNRWLADKTEWFLVHICRIWAF